MRKKLINPLQKQALSQENNWLNLEELAAVEISSEDPAFPIEGAFAEAENTGWQAGSPGKQTIRLLFDDPLKINHIRLNFVETQLSRTQEYVLRWSPDNGRTFHEIVRQQWNFSPEGAATETEEHHVNLSSVTQLELIIEPDIGGGAAHATLASLRLA